MLPLSDSGPSPSLMSRMPFSMVSYVRRFTCNHLQDTLFLMAWFAVCVAPFTASSRLLGLGSSVFPPLSLMLVLSPAHDPALFVHTSHRGRTLLLLYVDDMIITGDDSQFIDFVKQRLSDKFLMSDLGPLLYFLGLEVSSTSDGIYLSQEKYIQDLLSRDALTDQRTVDTPMELGVGSLVYLRITRPDISHAVHILS